MHTQKPKLYSKPTLSADIVDFCGPNMVLVLDTMTILNVDSLDVTFFQLLVASTHLASQVERPNPKLLSRGEDRSPLKYIINVLLSNYEYFIEKNLASQLEFGFPFLEDQNSG